MILHQARTPAQIATVALLILLGACRKTEPSPSPSAAAPARPVAPDWTAEKLRSFVVATSEAIRDKRGELQSKAPADRIIGDCYGAPATQLVKANELVPFLEQRLTGKALGCYLASYFGCRLGEWIGKAGVAIQGPLGAPFDGARTTIIEQGPDRVVADIVEPEDTYVTGGKLDNDLAQGQKEFPHKSRYTLTRDAQGVWKIADRVPSFSEWECRER